LFNSYKYILCILLDIIIIKLTFLHCFQSQLRMRIRLSYTANGIPIQDQTEVNNFPTPPDTFGTSTLDLWSDNQ